jgi:hypothetical protein
MNTLCSLVVISDADSANWWPETVPGSCEALRTYAAQHLDIKIFVK